MIKARELMHLKAVLKMHFLKNVQSYFSCMCSSFFGIILLSAGLPSSNQHLHDVFTSKQVFEV